MVDISTEYLGLKLANPLVPSASPLTKDVGSAKKLEDAGAAAVVMYSLFEEKIESEALQLDRFFYQQALGHGEASSFHPVPDSYKTYQDRYLEQIHQLKSALAIPVIASLNGITTGGWIEYGQALEQAGADALELNIFHLATNVEDSGEMVEGRYLDILRELKKHVAIPITMKLSSQFSSPVHFAKKLELAGANGLVLFNRFYQTDIDLETLHVNPTLSLSKEHEALLRIRWVALMYGRIHTSLAVTGGFHETADVLKALLAGADVVHLCSALLVYGPSHLTQIIEELRTWLQEHEYESVNQLKGSVSQQHAIDPSAYDRANYVQVLDNYSCPSGVLR